MIFFIILMLAPILIMVRNYLVIYERIKMNGLIFQQEDYIFYLRCKDIVSYDSMMLHFWIFPIHKMWPKELQQLRK